ncbi:beta-1,3-galactosyltransferase 1-like [Branchiostoma floridae]|uniref:Hexosyltransferase n=1 Tax=Branchiostoma floridae TaxID=7739 RepID=A0A9J7HF82_BRAFL|nr:beta-1,3-galactosyltransferase 1-like [Branchiostoma floridae]XP_035658381.1 beta-1,3-galactosyltransferase 1-like [Branchiostoma floridae]
MKTVLQSTRIWALLTSFILFAAYTLLWNISSEKVAAPHSDPKKKYSWHITAAEYHLDFIINPTGKCADSDLFLVVMVTSRHAHFEARATIRETWGNATSIMGYKLTTLFVIGRTDDSNLQRKLVEESQTYGDLVQMDSYESYENLTLKTISALKWTSINCKQAKFVMKTDDDMFVNYPRLVRILAEYSQTAGQENLMLGCVVSWAFPERTPGKKWYMDPSIFPHWLYPSYCIGAGYVISSDVAHKLYMTSLKVPVVQIEDVYLGMCAEKAGIKPQNHPEFSCWKDTSYRYCKFKELVTAHGMKPRDLTKAWADLKTQDGRNCSPKDKLFEKVSSLFNAK